MSTDILYVFSTKIFKETNLCRYSCAVDLFIIFTLEM
jgi:hypothetical protein